MKAPEDKRKPSLPGEAVQPTDPGGQQPVDSGKHGAPLSVFLGRILAVVICLGLVGGGLYLLITYERPTPAAESDTEVVVEEAEETDTPAEETPPATEESVTALAEQAEAQINLLAEQDLAHRSHRILFGQVSSEFETGEDKREMSNWEEATVAYEASLSAAAELTLSLQTAAQAKTARNSMREAQEQVLQLNGDTVLAVDYRKATEAVTRAEMEYEAGEFAAALESFQGADATFRGQITELNDLFRQSLNRGLRALNSGSGTIAREAFARALEIRPQDPFVQVQARRALTIEEVFAYNEAARQWEDEGLYELARLDYRAAIDLDPLAADALAGMERVSRVLSEGIYEDSMREGLQALKSEQGVQAYEAFARALSMNPTDPAAQDGVRQSEILMEEAYVSSRLATAAQALQAKNFQAAVDAYEDALRVQPSLTEARDGFRQAMALLQDEQAFEQLLTQADSFEANGQYERALLLLREARLLRDPNNAVSDRIDHLQGILAELSRPVEVTLISDGETNVDIFPSVGRYEPFRMKTIELRPGEYVIMGHRNRYRDVRMNVEIRAGEVPDAIRIVCSQPI